MRHRQLLIAALLLLGSLRAVADPLSIGIRGHTVELPLFSMFAAPGEELRIGLEGYDLSSVELSLDGSAYGARGDGHWRLVAPRQSGLYRLSLRHGELGLETELNLFVGHKLAHGAEDLEGYRIGPAPPGHERYPDAYRKPDVYFEVTQEMADTAISPHFTLGQFLCKQDAPFPKFVVLQESLLVLLEGIVEAVRDAGYPVETLGVISGYRTPWYNRSIGNVPNSRHVYGDAMDLFVDIDADGVMDDLDGNGRRDGADVDLLISIVEGFKKTQGDSLLVGGVGRYYKTANHGGFVHVDARGYRARW